MLISTANIILTTNCEGSTSYKSMFHRGNVLAGKSSCVDLDMKTLVLTYKSYPQQCVYIISTFQQCYVSRNMGLHVYFLLLRGEKDVRHCPVDPPCCKTSEFG